MTDPLASLRAALAARFEAGQPLEEGGPVLAMAGRDARLGHEVAIVGPDPAKVAPEQQAEMLRRVRAVAALQHPHVLRVLDSGVADGLAYWVTPLPAEGSLRTRLSRERQLPLADAVRLARQAAEALGAAAGAGVVHGGLDPGSIMLQGGHALVTGFEGAGGAAAMPRYESPEEAAGALPDPRRDQYRLGCVLYECLAGQPPFDGPSPEAIRARHARETVPRLKVVRASVPDMLEAVVRRLLAKSPGERFASWNEALAALREVETELAVERSGVRRSPTRTPMPQAAVAPPKRRTVVPLLAAAGALVLAALGAWRVLQRPSRAVIASGSADPRRVAVLYFASPPDAPTLLPIADGLSEDLIGELARVPGLVVVSRNGVEPFRGRGLPRDSVARLLGVGTLVMGSVAPAGRDSIRVEARLLDAGGTEIRRASFDRPLAALTTARDEVAAAVAGFLRERLGDEVRLREQRAATASADAWLLLQRAEGERKAGESALRRGDTLVASGRLRAADSLAGAASAADRAWDDPLVFRGNVAYRRSRLAVTDPGAAAPLIDAGLALADSVLERDSTDAAALELRGNLRYWRWLMRLDGDDAAADRLLAAARADLEHAVRRTPRQAGAWGSLSHLYYQTSGMTDVLLAAQRAYEADAYLENAATILDRLFSAAYDLDQPVPAARWCEEGGRRFPNDARFAVCQLYLMTMRGRTPDPARAWRIATSDVVRDDPSTGSPEFTVRQARMIVAMVLARAGLPDSAKAVIRTARAGSDVDPTKDLAHDEAFAQLLAGDRAASLAALKSFLAANPDVREGLAEDPGWWFRDLADDPEFRRVVGSAP
jgi:serine/threonine-protein kinase